jgi:hypothetical protein
MEVTYISTSLPEGAREDAESSRENTDYFGLLVKVIYRMEHCSLVCYRNRRFVASSEDLQQRQSIECAA